MAESTTQIHNLLLFCTTRITDILIGIVIGLLRSIQLVVDAPFTSRLPHLIARTIRSQSQLFFKLFSEQKSDIHFDESIQRNKMRTNLTNLKTVYNTALGEIYDNKEALILGHHSFDSTVGIFT